MTASDKIAIFARFYSSAIICLNKSYFANSWNPHHNFSIYNMTLKTKNSNLPIGGKTVGVRQGPL